MKIRYENIGKTKHIAPGDTATIEIISIKQTASETVYEFRVVKEPVRATKQ